MTIARKIEPRGIVHLVIEPPASVRRVTVREIATKYRTSRQNALHHLRVSRVPFVRMISDGKPLLMFDADAAFRVMDERAAPTACPPGEYVLTKDLCAEYRVTANTVNRALRIAGVQRVYMTVDDRVRTFVRRDDAARAMAARVEGRSELPAHLVTRNELAATYGYTPQGVGYQMRESGVRGAMHTLESGQVVRAYPRAEAVEIMERRASLRGKASTQGA